MLRITEMSLDEMESLLRIATHGHLACTREGHPYVVPMNFVYDSGNLYFLTTEGTKTEYVAANSEVCFQVEVVVSAEDWQSVMVLGRMQRLSNLAELEHATKLLTERNPALTPAISQTDIGAWHRSSRVATYRVHPNAIYGRKTANMK